MNDDFQKRLRQIMATRGLTMKELSLAAGLGETAVRDILERSSSPRIITVKAIGRALGMSLSELLEDGGVSVQVIPIIGAVSAGEGWSPIDDGLGEISLEIDGEAVAVEVRGDSMSPVYNSGDVLMGGKKFGTNIGKLIGRDCIVSTETGDRFLKFIAKSSMRGRFNLRSHNPAHPDIEAVAIAWAAPVLWVKRGM